MAGVKGQRLFTETSRTVKDKIPGLFAGIKSPADVAKAIDDAFVNETEK